MTWEIERKLNDKADKWELHNIQSENRELKNEIHELKRQIGNLEGTSHRQYYVIERLLSLLAEQPQFSEISNQIFELRGNL